LKIVGDVHAAIILCKTDKMVSSLNKICIDYVVLNFTLVDSLIGLPDIIAKDLFISYIQQSPCICSTATFNSPNAWLKDMTTFAAAFKRNVLQSIDLSGEWLFLSLQIEHLYPFLHLEELDISSCKIGNHHEILFHVGKLEFLKKLSMRNNNLSNDGIKNLTLYRRRALKGLERLEFLRLDFNKIDNAGFEYLCCLPVLKVLITDKKGLLLKMFANDQRLVLRHCKTPHYHGSDVFMDKFCEDHGWVTEQFKKCIKTSRTICHKRSSSASTKLFYKQRKISSESSKVTVQSTTDIVAFTEASFLFCNDSRHHAQDLKIDKSYEKENDKIYFGFVKNSSRCKITDSISNQDTFTTDPSILDIYASK